MRILLLFLIPYLPHLEQYKISNLPPTAGQFKYGDHFLAIQEGDDLNYYAMASRIYNLDFKESFSRGLAFPLMIVLFIFIFGNSFAGIFLPVVIFNGIFLFCGAIALIVWAAFFIFSVQNTGNSKIPGGKKIFPAVLSGFLFLIFPFIFYVLRNYGPQFKTGAWNDINFLNMNWLSVMTDPPAAFFTLLILFLLLIAEKRKSRPLFYSLIGFLVGFSMMIRITNIVIAVAAILVIFLFETEKRYKKIFFYCLSSLIAFMPQFVYNAVFFGSPLSFGYAQEYLTAWVTRKGSIMWNPGYFSHLIGRAVDYSVLVIPALTIVLSLLLLGIFYIARTSKRHAFMMALWFFFPVLIYMFFAAGQTAIRYYMPAVPALIILSVAALCAIFDWFKIKFSFYKID